MQDKNPRKIDVNKKTLLFTACMLSVLLLAIFFAPFSFSSAQAAEITLNDGIKVSSSVTKYWDGSIAKGFDGGGGTKENPYRIATGEQLAYLAELVNTLNSQYNNPDVYYILVDDIFLNDTAGREQWGDAGFDDSDLREWTPIGIESHTWSSSGWVPAGIGYRDFSANFDGKGYAISGVYINTDESCKGLFGSVYSGTISNTGVEQSYIKGNVYVGGIAGWLGSGSLSGCYNSGRVVNTGSNTGGIAGCVAGIGSIIINCYNTGAISGRDNTGGVAGQITEGGAAANCYNKGGVAGRNTVGGVAGYVNNGDNSYGAIANCYSIGNVSGNKNLGGVTGVVGNGCSVSFCYFLNTVNTGSGLSAVYDNKGGTVSNVSSFTGTGALASAVNVYGKEFSSGSSLTDALNAWVKYENKNNSGLYDAWDGNPFPGLQKMSAPDTPPDDNTGSWKWYYTLVIILSAVIICAAAGVILYTKKRKHLVIAPQNTAQALNGAALNPPPLTGDELDAVRQIIVNGQKPPPPVIAALPEGLTLREREVAMLLKDGKTSKEIAAALFISYETVKNHIKQILHKSDCRSRFAFASKYGGAAKET